MTKEELFGNSQQNTGYVSFEEIENAFKTPTQRQADYEPKPEPSPSPDDLGRLADPMGDAFHDFEQLPDEPEPVSPEKAQRTGMRIARLVDTGIDFTLSNFVARNGDTYRADPRDLEDIAECWGELAQEKGWSIGPEWSLVILYLMVYGPLVKQAVTDRRLAEHDARLKAVEERVDAIQTNNQTAENPTDNGNANPAPAPANNRQPLGYKLQL